MGLTVDDVLLLSFRDPRLQAGVVKPMGQAFFKIVRDIDPREGGDAVDSLLEGGRQICYNAAHKVALFYSRNKRDAFLDSSGQISAAAIARMTEDLSQAFYRHMTIAYATDDSGRQYAFETGPVSDAMAWEDDLVAELSAYAKIELAPASEEEELKCGLFSAYVKTDTGLKPIGFNDDPVLLIRTCLDHLAMNNRLNDFLHHLLREDLNAHGLVASTGHDDEHPLMVQVHPQGRPEAVVSHRLRQLGGWRPKDLEFTANIKALMASCPGQMAPET